MTRTRPAGLCCALLLLMALGAPLRGAVGPSDESSWRQDARNLLRYEKVAAKLRAAMTAFAADRQERKAIKGGEHLTVDRAMITYARLRRALAATAAKWEAREEANGSPLRPVLLAAAAHVVMAENGATLVENFAGTVWERKLSQEVRRHDLRVVDLFKDVAETLASGEHQKVILESLEVLDDQRAVESLREDDVASALVDLVTGSEVGHRPKDSLLHRGADRIRHRLTSLRRRIGRGMSKALGAYSRHANGTPYAEPEMHVTGKIVGKVGDFDRRRDDIRSHLQPGDILIFKHKGDIWDKLIPGYFCHTTVWLGTPAELEAMEVYHPGRNTVSSDRARAFRHHLEAGRTLLEADFVKVQIIPLDFSVGYYDTMTVLRLKSMAGLAPAARLAAQAEIVRRALYHLDQDYDFDFDLNTSDTIVCSELAYMAYPDDIDWPWAPRVGDATISPDNLAFMAGPLAEQPLEVVYFNDEGGEVVGAEAWKSLWSTFEGTEETDFPREDDPHRDRVDALRAKLAPMLEAGR